MGKAYWRTTAYMAQPLNTRRLTKELRDLHENPPDRVTVAEADDLKTWKLYLTGAPDTLYAGEISILQFRFGPNYPLESPEVVFTENIPVHPHVYSNGHICLDILYSHWTPIQTVASVCLSIQSMLSSCVKKERPPDDSTYVKTARKSPKDTSWSFHDDKI